MKLLDQPHRNYNLDEKGSRLTLHHQQCNCKKRVRLKVPKHGENVMMVACANATGGTVPPMIIFQGKNRRESFGEILPPLACFEVSEKAA